jgi:hypothetical protein
MQNIVTTIIIKPTQSRYVLIPQSLNVLIAIRSIRTDYTTFIHQILRADERVEPERRLFSLSLPYPIKEYLYEKSIVNLFNYLHL